jgi:pimeloyl-ACP methyl ester carboxylesterase
MKTDVRKQVYWLIACVVIIALSALMAYALERDFGKVEITQVRIVDPNGDIVVAKLYRPVTATAENKMPAIINMHGYQNDKDVQAPFSIELARRGFVVLAPDALGHGDSTTTGMNVAKWFADPTYVMGNETALAYLIQLPFVDASKIGAMGHSMGGMNAVKLPALFPDNVKALDQQASSPGSPELPNVLITQARFDEFAGFRENQPRTENLTSSETRLAALGLTGPLEWEKTYGNFADGTARKMTLINMDHHLLPLTNKAVAEAVVWMNLSLQDGVKGVLWIEPTSQIFMLKEIFGLITLLVTFFSLIPLTNILMFADYFKPVAQPIPNRYVASPKNWWIFATINALIGGILYPLTTQYGFIGGKVEQYLPFMKMQMANGVAFFFLANAVVCAVLFFIWYRGANKKGVTMYDMGASFDQEKTKFDWGILGKTLLLGVILFAWMYLLEGFFQWALGQEFRFAWPFMRQFSDIHRVGYFFLYIIPPLLFFLINGGVFLFGDIHQKEYETPTKSQWFWWLKNVYAMVFGLFLVWAFQYVPWFFMGQGPGFENVGLAQFSGIWPLMLFVYIPEFIILFFMHTWFYRRTGRIYLGALMTSILITWFMTAGTVIVQ